MPTQDSLAPPSSAPRGVLVIACGALAREIIALRRASDWRDLEVRCLPPELHNRPEQIPAAVQREIREHRARYREVFVAYGDCGTGGRLDALLRAEGIERLPGAHCYEAFATAGVFAELSDAEPGTFFLTDFLVRHFERLVWRGLGLDRHPELAGEYFRHYRRVVYLAQTASEELGERAREIAASLGLAYEHRHTGYGDLAAALARFKARRATDGEALAARREEPSARSVEGSTVPGIEESGALAWAS
ncbi:MAG TPA: DUF1638 domain-containing protein [Steroidobacteraceae bacterium]|nr:DUF1638 domain-containing protein [Steroidobacteraceae bacterium]